MQQVLVTTTNSDKFDTAKNYLLDRGLLYNKDTKKLYIKYNGSLVDLSLMVDNKNIVLNDSNEASLNDDVDCKTIKITPTDTAPSVYGNKLLGSVTTDNNILLLIKKSDTVSSLSGTIFEIGTGIASSYYISIANNGSRSFDGSSTFTTKAVFVQCTLNNGDIFYGLKFPSGIAADIYFSGYDNRDSSLLPSDTDYTNIADTYELVDESDKGSDSVVVNPDSGTKFTWDFTSVPDGFVNTNTTWVKNGGNDNANFDFGNGLVLLTATGTLIDTTLSRTIQDTSLSNLGGLLFCNSDSTLNSLELTLTGKCSITLYFISNNGTERTWYVYNESGATLASASSTSSTELTTITFDDATTGSHKIYIKHAQQSGLWYLYVNYDADISESLDNLPTTGEDGDPNRVVMKDLVLSLTDLQTIAAKCKDKNYLIDLDLSACSVDSTAAELATSVFKGCVSIVNFKLPSGITSISTDLFNGCTSLESITFNSDLTTISNSSIFYLTKLRTLYLPSSITTLTSNLINSDDIVYVYFHRDTVPSDSLFPWGLFTKYDGFTETVKVYLTQTVKNFITATTGSGSWDKTTYLGLTSADQMVVYTGTGEYGE